MPNQNTIEQLNALIGQQHILRQAQQLQGPQGQAQNQMQQQLIQQQLNQILARNQQQQQQQMQQQLQQQASNNALQQQLQQLVEQQRQQQQQQQQSVQNAQIAAAATAAASTSTPNSQDRKIPHTELVNASGQSIVGLSSTPGFQVSTPGLTQSATTPIPTSITPNAQQQFQKHFEGQTMLLQHALLQHANNCKNYFCCVVCCGKPLSSFQLRIVPLKPPFMTFVFKLWPNNNNK